MDHQSHRCPRAPYRRQGNSYERSRGRCCAKGAWGFDLSAACSAFVYALQTGAQFIATGAHKKVLVIGADVMSSIIDYTDRATCVIFGDGAGAVLLEPAE